MYDYKGADRYERTKNVKGLGENLSFVAEKPFFYIDLVKKSFFNLSGSARRRLIVVNYLGNVK